jgi:hypothetical protein
LDIFRGGIVVVVVNKRFAVAIREAQENSPSGGDFSSISPRAATVRDPWERYKAPCNLPLPFTAQFRDRALSSSLRLIVVLGKSDLIDELGVVILSSITVRAPSVRSLDLVFRFFSEPPALQLEILALRHQLGVLQRSVKRPKLTPADRLLWAWLCAVWNDWQSSVFIIKASTVISWHRKGFRLLWAWEGATRSAGVAGRA